MSNQINDIMATSLSNIKEIVDVNTVIGDAVQTPDGAVIIPICKICFGIATGGAEYQGSIDFSNTTQLNEKRLDDKFIVPVKYPFAGGCATGVSIIPTAFIKSANGEVELININSESNIEKLLNAVPDLFEKIYNSISKKNRQPQSEDGDNDNDID